MAKLGLEPRSLGSESLTGWGANTWRRGQWGEGLQNTKERDSVCPLTPGAEELVAWKVGRGTAGHLQQETQGAPCSSSVCSILRADRSPSVPAHLGEISVTNAGVLGLGSCPKQLSVATLRVRYTAIHCLSPQLTSSLLA